MAYRFGQLFSPLRLLCVTGTARSGGHYEERTDKAIPRVENVTEFWAQ